MLYDVDITETVERRVTVEARNMREAKAMAERGQCAWLDAMPGTTVHVQAEDVLPRLQAVDECDEFKYRAEG